MKKLMITAIAFLVLGIGSTNAQESTFNKGDKVFNASIGLGSVLYNGLGYSTTIPPISGSLELGVKENFIMDDLTLGIGGYVGFSKYQYRWSSAYNWGWDYTNFIIGGRAAVHYPLIDKLDTYAGILMGINLVSSKEYGTNTLGYQLTNNTGGGIAWSTYIGGRYYFTDRIAALGELGYGISYLNIGVSFKL
jgi:hypothetical protein